MAGHSKWANIMYRKGAQDARRAKRFTKLIREVYVAAREGAPDPDHNPRLRTAMAAAKSQSVPKDNIERAIKKAAGGDGGQERFDTLSYEGFGPGGIAVIVDAITDNRNRTAATIRSIFSRHGGTLGETGSVNYLFQRVGIIRFSADAASGDDMFEAALEVGADECESEADGHEVICAPESLSESSEALSAAVRSAGAGRDRLAPADHRAHRREQGGGRLQATGSARRQRRRAAGLGELRCHRRCPAQALGLSGGGWHGACSRSRIPVSGAPAGA